MCRTAVSWICLLPLVLTGAACLPTARLDTPLKTEPQKDPYAETGDSFWALCYHDVRDDLRGTMRAWPESTALDTYDLIQQFEWLRDNGYHVVSMDTILAARRGGPRLPPRAVLLTFDDGYRSMYTRVFPLLKLFNYPAVLGLVGAWLEDTPDGQVFYGNHFVSRERFLTWLQVREMVASGLVEVASHSHSLHQGALANPQGGMPSAAITRVYHPVSKRYENDAEYFARLRADLARNSMLLAQHIGKRPRIMIWPYGAYNMPGVRAAAAEAMPITMTLDDGPNPPDQPLERMRRTLMLYSDKISDLKHNLNLRVDYGGVERPVIRVVALDLGSLYDPDPQRQDQNIGALVERILRLRVNTVYLRAVADADGDGLAEAAYFPNRHLPLRADLLNRVAWQLRTRSSVAPDIVQVYAWLPLLAFKLPARHPAAADLAATAKALRAGVPLSPEVRQTIREIYADAGANGPRLAGLVVGVGSALDEPLPDGFPTAQAEALTDFALELASVFKEFHPAAQRVRLLASANAFARRGDATTAAYAAAQRRFEFVALSLPAAKTAAAAPGLQKLTYTIARQPGALRNTVLLLPSFAAQHRLPSERLADQLQLLQRNGVRNLGYYPDLAVPDHPATAAIRSVMSLNSNPGRQP